MISRLADFLCSRHGCLMFIGGYFLILFTLRITLFPGASEDDAEQLFFSQIFAWGYKVNQPTLYTWLVILAQKIFGVSAASVAAVKFSALFALFYFTRQSAHVVFNDNRYAALAALSLLAIFYINWDGVVNYSHTILMAAFLMATLYVFLKIKPEQSILAYIGLGVLMGLGLLSKYNFALFLIPLFAAAVFTPSFRHKILTPKFLISILIAAALLAPHLQWLLANPASISTTPEYMDVAGGTGSAVVRAGKGLLDAVSGAALFLAPLWLLYLLFFWRSFTPLKNIEPEDQETKRFFEIYFAAFAFIVVIGIIIFSLSGIRNHWMMVLIPFPVYFLLRVRAISPQTATLDRFAVLLAAFAVIVAIALFSRAMTAPNYCKKCNFFFPYAALAEQIKGAGFQGGTIITYDLPNQLGGNLRRYFPDSRVISRRYSYFVPAERTKGQCLLVWNESKWAHGSGRSRVINIAKELLGVSVPAGKASKSAAAPLPRAKNKSAKLGFLILPRCE
jgi:4-amino-4-deoxy-L-arabinose transferase-like glycosyltransferase